MGDGEASLGRLAVQWGPKQGQTRTFRCSAALPLLATCPRFRGQHPTCTLDYRLIHSHHLLARPRDLYTTQSDGATPCSGFFPAPPGLWHNVHHAGSCPPATSTPIYQMQAPPDPGGTQAPSHLPRFATAGPSLQRFFTGLVASPPSNMGSL